MQRSSTQIGRFLRELREGKKLTIQAVSKKAGVHFTHISHIELGRSPVSDKMLKKLASIYRVSPGVLAAKREEGKAGSVIIPEAKTPKAQKKQLEVLAARATHQDSSAEELAGLEFFSKALVEERKLNIGNAKALLDEAKQRIKDVDMLDAIQKKAEKFNALAQMLTKTQPKRTRTAEAEEVVDGDQPAA